MEYQAVDKDGNFLKTYSPLEQELHEVFMDDVRIQKVLLWIEDDPEDMDDDVVFSETCLTFDRDLLRKAV